MNNRTAGRRPPECSNIYQQGHHYSTGSAPRFTLNFNGIPPFRNLPKQELASVIFGCKDSTFGECMKQLIFGLPSRHICYVRNVEPGMPIFLFNYSNRTLHGIFEACSYGALNISPKSWTKDDSEATPFPAQVCVRIRQLCHPLPEEKFKRAIFYNYYKRQNKDHFFFELDKYQTGMLLDLMVCEFPRSGHVENEEWKARSGKASGTVVPIAQQTMAAAPLPTCKTGNVLSTILPGEAEKYFSASDGGMSDDDDDDDEDDSSDTSSETDMHIENGKESMSTSSTEKECDSDLQVKLKNLNVDDSTCEKDPKYADVQNQGLGCLIREDTERISEANGTINTQHQNEDKALKLDCLKQYIQKSISAHGQPQVEQPAASLDDYFKYIVDLQMKNAELERRYDEVVSELQCLKQEITRMSTNGRVGTYRFGSSKTTNKDTDMEDQDQVNSNEPAMFEACSPRVVNRWNALEQYSIYLLGGFDGSSCLQDVDVFYPATLRSVQFPKMQTPRFSAAGGVLYHRMYVFGGGDGLSRSETVETFDMESKRWLFCISMKLRRSNLASVVVGDRIFAIGGQHDKSTLSEVEYLDPNLGEWHFTPRMVSKRYSAAAVELGGAIYAIGGYNGQEHLSSVERFDSREPFWTEVCHMHSKRSALHAAALTGKIYAVGGYDGDRCLNSMECYEPRKNCWIQMNTQMHVARASGAVAVVGDSLYIFGGVDMQNASHEKVILETAECFSGAGDWDILALPTLGKRTNHVGLVLT